jgi:CheY-like chemotaxis protein
MNEDTDVERNEINIIHVDDDEDDRELFKEALMRIPKFTRLRSFMDCESMVRALLKKSESIPFPNIVFLDINMPVKSGISCLKELREDKRYERTPVVMFTTSARPSDVQEARKSGANLFLIKPPDFNELISMLNKLFAPRWYENLMNGQETR